MGTFTKKTSYQVSNYHYENEVLTCDFSCRKNETTGNVTSIDGQFNKDDEKKTYIGGFNVSNSDTGDMRVTTNNVPYSMKEDVDAAIKEIVEEMIGEPNE